LISTKINGNSFVDLLAANSRGITTDDIPCADGLMVCSGTTADDVPYADGSIAWSGASTSSGLLGGADWGGEGGTDFCRFG